MHTHVLSSADIFRAQHFGVLRTSGGATCALTKGVETCSVVVLVMQRVKSPEFVT